MTSSFTNELFLKNKYEPDVNRFQSKTALIDTF